MFLKYLEPIFRPWREARNKIVQVKTTKGRFRAEVGRVKRFGNLAGQYKNQAQGHLAGAQGQMQKAQGQMQKAQGQVQGMQGQAPGMPPQSGPMGQMQGQTQGQMPGQMHPAMMQGGQMQQGGQMAGPMGQPGPINPNPPVRTVGFFRRRKVCTQCNAELDKTWDSCPYCAQAAQAAHAAQAAANQPGKPKTQAFNLNATGGSVQLMGWLVPIKGAQRGELFTLAPQSIIGTDATSHVVLLDNYMSGKHAEIKAEGGIWVLRDLNSTNGTWVNDKRVDTHELVDNDMVKFGNSICKFKSL